MGAAEHRRRLVSLAHPVYFELLAGVTAGIINMVRVARLGGGAVAAVAVATACAPSSARTWMPFPEP
jgi:Na+-driven multidrug efflux pump